MTDMSSRTSPNAIRWRARRGTLELDAILTRFLDQHLESMTAEDRESFAVFLQLSDDKLIAWLVERQGPVDVDYQGWVNRVLVDNR